MPRQRIHHSRVTYQVPHDFPERLERFKEESGLSWAEIIRRLDIHHETMRRWRKGRARPSMRNMMALVALARPLGLGHPLPGLSPSAPVTSALPNESGCIIIEAPLAAVPQGAEAKTTPEGRGREGRPGADFRRWRPIRGPGRRP